MAFSSLYFSASQWREKRFCFNIVCLVAAVSTAVAAVAVTAGVAHLGHIAGVAVDVVVDGLHAAVGEVHVVGALGVLAAPLLVVAEVDGAAVAAAVAALLAAAAVAGNLVAVLERQEYALKTFVLFLITGTVKS